MVKLSEEIQKAVRDDEKHNPTVTYSWNVRGHPLEMRNVGYGVTEIYLDDKKVGSYEFLPAGHDSRPSMNAYGMTVRFFNQDTAFKWLTAATTWYLKNSLWGYKHGMDPHKLINYGSDKVTTQEWDTVDEVVESFIDKEMGKVVDSFKKIEENQELNETKADERGIVHPDIDFDRYVYVNPHRVEYYKDGKQIKVHDPLKKTKKKTKESVDKFSDFLTDDFYTSETLLEVSPPGMEDRVESLKKHIRKSNPRISKKKLNNMAFGRAWNEYNAKKK